MFARKIGKLTVLDELGSGAGGRVFRIRLAADSLEYALKVVAFRPGDPRPLERARHEFRVGRMLDHPNLVRVHAFDTESDWLFRPRRARLLSEFASGRPANTIGPLAPGRLARVLARVADALAHMHDRGVFHADLKPGNLILGPDDGVKLIDYGLARVRGEPVRRVQGTPEYMAPETAARAVIDERTEVYNLGATMFRLLTGRALPAASPAGGFDPRSRRRVLIPVSELSPDAPAALCDLIERCLATDPGCRPQSMTEVSAILARIAGECPAERRS